MCAQICECTWKPEVHVGIVPDPVLSLSFCGEQNISLNPELTDLAGLAGRWVPGICLSTLTPPNQCKNCKCAPLCSAFYIGSEDLNSGPHTPKTTFYYGLSYVPSRRLVSRLLSGCATSIISATERNRPRLTAQRPNWGMWPAMSTLHSKLEVFAVCGNP